MKYELKQLVRAILAIALGSYIGTAIALKHAPPAKCGSAVTWILPTNCDPRLIIK